MALIFGHASGFSWDEALLVLAPLIVIGAILIAINRRAGRLQDEALDEEALVEDHDAVGGPRGTAPEGDGHGIGAG